MTAERRLTPAAYPDRLPRPPFPFCEDFQICTTGNNSQYLLISAGSVPNTAKCFTWMTWLILKTKQLFLALFCRRENGRLREFGNWLQVTEPPRKWWVQGSKACGLLNLKKLWETLSFSEVSHEVRLAQNHLGEVSFLPRPFYFTWKMRCYPCLHQVTVRKHEIMNLINFTSVDRVISRELESLIRAIF